jgi:signal peptidase I
MNVMIILIIFVIFFPLLLWKIFEQAGFDGWKSAVPLYNYYIWLKVIDKGLWWYIFLLIPFINFFMMMLMIVETAKCYGKYHLGAQVLAVVFPYVYMPYLGIAEKEIYIIPTNREKVKKSVAREWTDAIIFAVVAATIIRVFLIEAYTIPTSSMEKSLLVGDFLFVSKLSYGPKVPNTPLAFPFVHHTLPLTDYTKSYVEWIKIPYYRFPGFDKIKNNDVVVFNYPDGDTVALKVQNQSYYAMVREFGRERIWNDKQDFGDITSRPVDKRENYIKRCIGIPGDTIKIVDEVVYINGKIADIPRNSQFKYAVKTNGTSINPKIIEKLDITEDIPTDEGGNLIMTLTEDGAQQIKALANVLEVKKIIQPTGLWQTYIFPFDSTYPWNVDNFGPLYIPKAGATVSLTTHNLPLYSRIINAYENNSLAVKDGKIYINGKESNSYTFKMDYYWMMGDNRHNSADSRFWGFVPIDHIVGKAVFVWLSLDPNKSLLDGKIRLSKLFRFIH